MKIRTKTILSLPAFAILAIATASCGGDEPEPPVAACQRGVLVYMAADNSLGSQGFDTDDLDEMETAVRSGRCDGARVIVYHASRTDVPVLKEVTPEGIKELKRYTYDASSVSRARMEEVLADFRSEVHCERRGLVLWSHSSGWIENGIEHTAPKSWGDDRGRHMNVSVLAQVLEPEEFDYIYFDCCQMANIESLYELRRCAPTIAGYSTEVPAAGMPYDVTLPLLCAFRADVVGAAKATFAHYDGLAGRNRTCSVTVTDTSALDALARATADVFASGTPDPGYLPLPLMEGTCHLYDFADYIRSYSVPDGLRQRWEEAFDAAVVWTASTPELWGHLPLERATGLSCFILHDAADAAYKGYDRLQWWQQAGKYQFDR